MKNVLFIGMSPNKGGVETYMMNVFLRLEGHGFHFEFINTYHNKHLAYYKLILHNGGVIRDIPKLSSIYLSKFNNIERHFIRNKIIKIFLYHYKNYYDVIYVNALYINNMCWLKIANDLGIHKLILHSHMSDYYHTQWSNIRKIFSRSLAFLNRKYLKSHNITELAASTKSGKWMFRNNKFIVVPNGIDTHKYLFNRNKREYFRNKLNINRKSTVFITVAKISYQKNYNKIIHVFKEYHNMYPSSYLIIIGNGPERNKIVKMVNKFKLNKYVMFLGMINNVNDVLNVADIMLMPSRFEGLPFSLMESQSSGVPALVSKAIPEVANVTGCLRYLSLTDSDKNWAKMAYNILNNFSIRDKYIMNNSMSKSKYNINNTIQIVKDHL